MPSSAPIDPAARIGHAHLKVPGLDRAPGSTCGVPGFALARRLGDRTAFVSAGGCHHHIGLDTRESLGVQPPGPGATGLSHLAILYPGRAARADALRRLRAAPGPGAAATLPAATGLALCMAMLLLSPATAASAPSAPATAPAVGVAYVAYAAALPVLRLHASYAIGPAAYEVKLAFDTAGMFAVLLHAHVDSTASGGLEDSRAHPARYYSAGDFRGRPHVTQIDYSDGQPHVVQLAPPVEEEREPVLPAQQTGTIDNLSAMAELVSSVARTGRCDGTRHTFDGHRLSELSSRTVGEETLAPTGRSTFSGRALRCDLEGRQLAGFPKDADRAAAARPLHGSAWFASISPGTPAVPVRISFETRFFGAATAYLVAK